MKFIKLKHLNFHTLVLIMILLIVVFPSAAMAVDLQEKIQNKDNVVGWGTLALINAGIAQGKNRSGFNWFLASLFLGPLATFLLVMSNKNFITNTGNKNINL